MDKRSDEEIVACVAAGDTGQFGHLVERYEAKLSRYARKFLACNEDIADVIQEVFIKAYANINSFDPGRRFSPWIYRIAHNECVNELKRRVRRPLPLFDFDTILPRLISGETADGFTDTEDLKRILDRCLRELKPKYREPLILYYYEELDYQAIAEVLKIPVSAVGVRLKRGREALRKIYEQEQ